MTWACRAGRIRNTVIASVAKQSRASCPAFRDCFVAALLAMTWVPRVAGLPRRCAPRNDMAGVMTRWGAAAVRVGNIVIASVAKQSRASCPAFRDCRVAALLAMTWVLRVAGLPRRCAPRNDMAGVMTRWGAAAVRAGNIVIASVAKQSRHLCSACRDCRVAALLAMTWACRAGRIRNIVIASVAKQSRHLCSACRDCRVAALLAMTWAGRAGRIRNTVIASVAKQSRASCPAFRDCFVAALLAMTWACWAWRDCRVAALLAMTWACWAWRDCRVAALLAMTWVPRVAGLPRRCAPRNDMGAARSGVAASLRCSQ